MAALELWHNPRCSKSRAALALLEAQDRPFSVRLYLEAPPSREALAAAIQALGLTPRTFIRRKEEAFKTLGLAEASEDACLDAMVAQPVLMERPVLVTEDRAALGRPDSSALSALLEALPKEPSP
jgi:arsenate reductase (glutaredoxin)